jgi:hypothetical protein
MALLASCAVMVGLGVVFLAGVVDVAADRRVVVGIALLSAGVFDLFIGLRLLRSAE